MQRINQKQMRKMMQRMGMKQEEIPAEMVLIKTPEKEIVITNPSVVKVNMMGEDTFQINGEVSERSPEIEISEEDLATVTSQTGADKETAMQLLKKNNGDIAKTILELSSE